MSQWCDGQDSCKRQAQRRSQPHLVELLENVCRDWIKHIRMCKNPFWSLISQFVSLQHNWNRPHFYLFYDVAGLYHSPFMSSWALTVSNLRALRKRSSRESGLSPNCLSTSLARSSCSSALSLIMARRSFSVDARLSSVSFSSSLAW